MSSFKIAMAPQKDSRPAAPDFGFRSWKLTHIFLLALAIILGAGWIVGLYYALSEIADALAAVVAVPLR